MRRQRGFTLVEVLVSLLVFAVAVVGLVAMEARAIESQKAGAYLRDAERVGQDAMADLQERGFLDLIERDFAGNPNPNIPYDDDNVAAVDRLRDYRRPPADFDPTVDVIGSVRGQYIVFRSVDWVFDPAFPPTNPPVLGTDEALINALVLEVTVLWIDDTNQVFPPPPGLQITGLTLAMIDPADTDFRPFVGSMQLRTVRVNDATIDAGLP